MSDSHGSAKSVSKHDEDDGKKALDVPPHPSLPEDSRAHGRMGLPYFIKYKGVFDFQAIYKFMVGWLKKRGFEFYETLYKAKPPELEIRWMAERRKNGFGMDKIHVHFHIYGDHNYEVVEHGHKKSMFNARMTITIEGEIEVPYEDIFGRKRWTTPMDRKILNLFMKYVMRQEVDLLHADALYYEMQKFQADIKNYLRMTASGTGY